MSLPPSGAGGIVYSDRLCIPLSMRVSWKFVNILYKPLLRISPGLRMWCSWAQIWTGCILKSKDQGHNQTKDGRKWLRHTHRWLLVESSLFMHVFLLTEASFVLALVFCFCVFSHSCWVFGCQLKWFILCGVRRQTLSASVSLFK